MALVFFQIGLPLSPLENFRQQLQYLLHLVHQTWALSKFAFALLVSGRFQIFFASRAFLGALLWNLWNLARWSQAKKAGNHELVNMDLISPIPNQPTCHGKPSHIAWSFRHQPNQINKGMKLIICNNQVLEIHGPGLLQIWTSLQGVKGTQELRDMI